MEEDGGWLGRMVGGEQRWRCMKIEVRDAEMNKEK